MKYTTIEKEALVMVYVLHKFWYFDIRKQIFVLMMVYLICKPDKLGWIVHWLLIFGTQFPNNLQTYGISFGRNFFSLLNFTKDLRIPNHIANASFFILHPIWM